MKWNAIGLLVVGALLAVPTSRAQDHVMLRDVVGPAGGQQAASGGHGGSTGIDSDETGVLPVDGGDKFDLKFKHQIVDGFAFDVGVWHAESVGLDFGVVLDPLGGVTVTLAGDSLMTGTAAILDGLPGGSEPATAGTTGCWSAPGPVSGPTSIKVTGEGPTLGAAVADYKQQVDELQDLGFTPLPSGDCAPTVDPQVPDLPGPMSGPGHP